ncbi:MAG TPA: HNH endonuclease [Vicinamibacterales bacterium]|nr:HNH endonuclease [Vicinamibacterales bacterium]
MPTAPLKPCAQSGCEERVQSGRCAKHRGQARQASDRERGSAHERGYGSHWRKRSQAFLKRYRLCGDRPAGRWPVGSLCRAAGRVSVATVTDHVRPHKGDQDLFWDELGNWQALCRDCHNAKTATLDGGFGRPAAAGPAAAPSAAASRASAAPPAAASPGEDNGEGVTSGGQGGGSEISGGTRPRPSPELRTHGRVFKRI